jgi:hypothetical protein
MLCNMVGMKFQEFKGGSANKKSFSNLAENFCMGVFWAAEFESGLGFSKFSREISEIRGNPRKSGKFRFF